MRKLMMMLAAVAMTACAGENTLGISITDNLATRKFSAETLIERTIKRKTVKKTLEKYFITFQLKLIY